MEEKEKKSFERISVIFHLEGDRKWEREGHNLSQCKRKKKENKKWKNIKEKEKEKENI